MLLTPLLLLGCWLAGASGKMASQRRVAGGERGGQACDGVKIVPSVPCTNSPHKSSPKGPWHPIACIKKPGTGLLSSNSTWGLECQLSE